MPLGFIVVPTDGTEARYVCTVAGITGSSEPTWPTSGDVVDNEVTWDLDESDDWKAELVDMTEYTYELSAEEKAVQGADNLTVRAWVQAVDAFDNVSETVATGSGEGLNQKSYSVTVGPTGSGAKYTTIEDAIAALPNGGTIILKDGLTLQLSAAVTIPDVNLEILGENQGGVILKNHAGDNLFEFGDLTETFRLANFSIESQNTSSYSNMIHIEGTAAANNTARITIENLAVSLADDGDHQGSGDVGIYALKGSGSLLIKNNEIIGGADGISISEFSEPKVLDNVLESQTGKAISIKDLSWMMVSRNKIKDFVAYGVYINTVGVTMQSIEVTFNEIRSRDDSLVDKNLIGIYVYGQAAYVLKGVISFNTIEMTTSRTASVGLNLSCIRINPYTGTTAKLNLLSNMVSLAAVADNPSAGLDCARLVDSQVANNTIVINHGGATWARRGISFVTGCLRNVVQGNNINLTNNAALDYGIVLFSGNDNNQGGDNITYNVGTSVSDSGSGNSVTAKDV